MSELKPCPLCGNEGRITEATELYCEEIEGKTVWGRKFAGYYISCSSPNCIRFPSKFRVLDKGIFAWNTRPANLVRCPTEEEIISTMSEHHSGNYEEAKKIAKALLALLRSAPKDAFCILSYS